MIKQTTGTITSMESVGLDCADFETVLVHVSWAASTGTLFFGFIAQGATTLGASGYDVTATGAPALVGNVSGTGATITQLRRYDVRGVERFLVAGAPGNSGTVTVKIQAYVNSY